MQKIINDIIKIVGYKDYLKNREVYRKLISNNRRLCYVINTRDNLLYKRGEVHDLLSTYLIEFRLHDNLLSYIDYDDPGRESIERLTYETVLFRGIVNSRQWPLNVEQYLLDNK